MALGTNYARGKTLKQEYQMHIGMARISISEGKTRDEHVATASQNYKKVAGKAYDEAKAE